MKRNKYIRHCEFTKQSQQDTMEEESFHFKYRGSIYEIVPEEDQMFTVFKMAEEYMLITKLNGKKWVQIDYKTDEPIIEQNDEVEDIGRIIESHFL